MTNTKLVKVFVFVLLLLLLSLGIGVLFLNYVTIALDDTAMLNVTSVADSQTTGLFQFMNNNFIYVFLIFSITIAIFVPKLLNAFKRE